VLKHRTLLRRRSAPCELRTVPPEMHEAAYPAAWLPTRDVLRVAGGVWGWRPASRNAETPLCFVSQEERKSPDRRDSCHYQYQ
jgi:hypothetical protein